jgi:hypothetical protein
MGNAMANPSMYGFVFTNNIVISGKASISNTSGHTSCAVSDVPITSLNNCFSSYTFANNDIVASPAKFPSSSWPQENSFLPTAGDVGFMNYNNGNSGNYQLAPGSPYRNVGMDGRDLGADIVGLNQALAGVE